MSKVHVVMTGHGRGEVFIDGVKVPRLIKFSLHCEPNETNRVRLELFADEVEFEGISDVTCLDSNCVEQALTKVIGKVGSR